MDQKTIHEEIDALRGMLRERLARRASGGCASALPGFDEETILDLVLSRTTPRAHHDDEAVDRWITSMRARPHLRAEPLPLERLKQWYIDGRSGNINHRSGRFFTILGIQARHRGDGRELEWDQPIIDQPEIGILGIVAKKIGGVLHFCLQAKEEPGNLHSVQLSPTVQATHSNYSKVHGGSAPPFIDLFLDPPQERIVYAKLQTEDGGRFLFKSNRNMIVKIGESALNELPDGFIWLTLRQIGRLLRMDNLINACARSVLSAVF